MSVYSPSPTPVDFFDPETVDGTALKEVAQMLIQLESSSDFVREGVLAFLKNRSHPAYLMHGWDKPIPEGVPVDGFAHDSVTIEGQP